MSSSDELILLERVFLRVGSADTDEQLENAVSKFLPPVLLKLSSPNEAVRNKVMELLAHINKRVKNRATIQLPVEALLVQYQDPAASVFITNFTIIYIKLGFPRLAKDKQEQLVPTLVHAADGKPVQHQESLLFLLLGSLGNISLPRTDAQSKSFLGLSEKPKLTKLLLDIILDLLLLPYGWAGENPPPELSVYSYRRILSNLSYTSVPDKLEQLKSTMVKFLSCGVLNESDTLVHLIVASGDSRSSVSNAAELQLRKITGGIDWDSTSVVMPLYAVYLGGGEAEKKRGPACTRLRLKLLPHMTKARTVVWPAAIKVLFDSLYGENTNGKLKSLGLSFCSNIIHNVSVDKLGQVANVILESGLLKLLRSSPGDLPLCRQAYSVMGQLVVRVPAVINSSGELNLLKILFTSLMQEVEPDMQMCIRDVMIVMCSAYKNLNESKSTALTTLLVEMLNSQVPKCRYVAVHYISEALPRTAHQLYILLSAATHVDEDVAAEAKKALYGTNYKSGGNKSEIVLPPFTDLLVLIIEKETTKKKVDVKLHSEIVFYLRLCLAHASGVKASLEQVVHPCESSILIGRYLRQLHQTQTLLIDQYISFINRLMDTEVNAVGLAALLECAGCLPETVCANLRTRMDTFKALLGNTKEEVRSLASQLVGVLSPVGSLETAVQEYTKVLENETKDYEKLHGTMLALGYLVERAGRKGVQLTDPKPVTATVKLLKHNHSMVVSGACLAVGLMGQSKPLPLSSSEKLSLVEDLLAIVLDQKHSSKVKDRACNALALVCVGEDFPCREKIVSHFIDHMKEVKDIELHLSTGECMVNAILGESSPDALDPWNRDLELEARLRASASPHVIAKSNSIAENFLNRVLALSLDPHPHQRQSCCFWLLAITKHCGHLDSVSNRLQDIQSAFMELLSDKNGAVQEAAGKGLALVYQSGDVVGKSELLAKVVEQLTVGKRAVNLVSQDTKLFEEGELGKAPTGENLSTYKELCSLASDLNQPDLIYKFMHLANHNAIWNSKKGAAYGVSSLVTMAGEEMEEYLPKIVAKLYRYQYDPTPSVQQTMAAIWSSLTANCSNAVDKYHKEIFDDLLLNLTSSQWRVRMSCCEALSDFVRGGGSKIFQDCQSKIGELWKQLFRVMDDFHEGTREAAVNTARILSKICIRHCEKEIGKKELRISGQILPILLQVGIKHNVAEVRAVSVSTVSEIVKNGVSGELVTEIVPALLVAAAELESATLNELSVMYSASRQTQDAIDSARASAVKSHFTVQTLARCVQYVKPEMMEELSPQMIDLLKTSVGLGSRIATSHFLVLLIHHLTVEEIQPYVGKFLGALLNGLTDRNAAIRKNYATTIGQLTRCAKDSSVDRLITKLKNLYFDKEDDSSKNAVCYTLQAMVNYSQDAVKNRSDLVIPLVFFAKHQEKKIDGSNKSILETWEEVWDDVCGSQGVLKQNEHYICETLENTIQSQSWQNKAQAARAIKSLASKLEERMSEEWRDKLIKMLASGLSGRTWDGKENLLDALAAVCKISKGKLNPEIESTIIDAVIKECQREKMTYRCHALRCLAQILHSLDIDRFETVYPIINEIIKKDVKSETRSDDAEECLEMRESLVMLKETAYDTLGKSWPSNRDTQEKYRETVVEECVLSLSESTRQVQVTIMSALVSIVEKLTLLKNPPITEEDKMSLSKILLSTNKALVYSLGISKHTKLRKEALNLLFTLAKTLKGVNDEEYKTLEEVFLKFADEISRDSAPEIKSRFIDIKQSFQNDKTLHTGTGATSV